MADFTFQVTDFVFQGAGEFVFQGSTDTPIVVIDTHDGVGDEIVRQRLRKEHLHQQVVTAFDEVYAVAPSVQAAVEEIVQESREWFPQYRLAFDLPQYLDTVRMMAEHAARAVIEADDEEVLMILRDRNG